jgi:hypothetical protein
MPKPTGTEARVCADIAKRQALGLKKYGVTVEKNPLKLRAWLNHAYEETLDKAVYLKRAIEEMDKEMSRPPRKDAEHSFSLSGLNAGDVFSGCWTCWFQTNVSNPDGTPGVHRKCPRCHRAGMRVFTVTKEDLSAANAP